VTALASRPGAATAVAPSPSAKTVRVLICDDSGFMRLAIRKMLSGDPSFQVVGEARNGAQAVEMTRRLSPDVITMDVEMPEMTGIAATEAIMAERPTPIIMVSSITERGAQATFDAMRAGAVDYISKSSSFVQLDIVQIETELKRKIRHWVENGPKAKPVRASVASVVPAGTTARPGDIDLVVVAVSTGGPRMFLEMLQGMGPIGCPMIVAQHMPQHFTSSFAHQLSVDTGLSVLESKDGLIVGRDQIVILEGGIDSIVERFGGEWRIRVKRRTDSTIQPNADILFHSALAASTRPLGVVMTGMGEDGADACRAFAARGLPVLVQEPSTCVVSGMPDAAIATGAATEILPLDRLGRKLRNWCADRSARNPA